MLGHRSQLREGSVWVKIVKEEGQASRVRKKSMLDCGPGPLRISLSLFPHSLTRSPSFS